MTVAICVKYRIDHKPAYNDLENGEDHPAGQEGRGWQIPASSDNDNDVHWDHRMTTVINRYESTVSGVESQALNVVEDETAALAKRLMRMPTIEDPGLWKVRVWVSPLYFVSE